MGVLVDFISEFLQFFYNLGTMIGIYNYGFAIIIFTIVVKVLLFPLTAKQIRSMHKMQELQPEIKKIQKKYKKDPKKSQEAVMKLYQKHGANPFTGCIPIIIQLPILYALFQALRVFFDPQKHPAYVNLEHAEFFWIGNLGVPDPYILPILAAVTTFIQMSVTSSGNLGAAEGPQKMFKYVMPVFMGWICHSFPAGLALYWFVYAIMSTLEQLLLRRGQKVKEVVKADEKH